MSRERDMKVVTDRAASEHKTGGGGARLLWTSAGTFFLALGIVGIPLPILPTTPFLLLAAACYLRGSEKMYKWLLTNRMFGQYLSDYREKRGVPWTIKIVALVILWSAMGLTVLVAVSDVIIQIIIIAIAFFVTLHILTIKTRSG